MRVTNSMIINNFMNNLNINLTRMDNLQTQLASGRKFAHISDDPIALIYSQSARNRLARLSHYQGTINTAQDWLKQVEGGLMELEGRVADVYNSTIDAATDVKGQSDKDNIAQLMAQLRDQYLDTLNTTFGDRFIYAGYNTPGNSQSGKITGPFTIDNNWNLYYNGQNLSNMLQLYVTDGFTNTNILPEKASGIFGGLNIDITGSVSDAVTAVYDALDKINGILPNNGILQEIARINGEIKTQADIVGAIKSDITGTQSIIAQLDEEILNLPENLPQLDALKLQRETKLQDLRNLQQNESVESAALYDLYSQRDQNMSDLNRLLNTDAPQYDVDGRVALSIGGIPLIDFDTLPANVPELAVDPAAITNMMDILDMMNTLKADVLTFDVGPGVSMDVTFNGIDLIMYQSPDNTTLNIFNVLHEIYNSASNGDPAEFIGGSITKLQYAQNHLLKKVAEIGGRTNRLDLLSARYEQDAINYEQMKSDAEDADFAEVIMYQKMAEAVYQAALSAGARIIQPTLMDFLR